MESPVYKKYTLNGFVLALFANILIIVLLTQLIKAESEKNEKIYLNAVTIADFRPEQPVKEKKYEKEQKKEEEKEEKKIIKPKSEKIYSENPNLNLEMPAFEINPRIDGADFALPEMKVENSASIHDFNRLFDMKKLDAVPIPKFKRSPVYPYRAKRMGIEGEVSVSFIVNKNGKVSDVKILQAKPEKIFDQSVIDAVSSWEYSPGELMGKNVRTLVTTKVIFKLEE